MEPLQNNRQRSILQSPGAFAIAGVRRVSGEPIAYTIILNCKGISRQETAGTLALELFRVILRVAPSQTKLPHGTLSDKPTFRQSG